MNVSKSKVIYALIFVVNVIILFSYFQVTSSLKDCAQSEKNSYLTVLNLEEQVKSLKSKLELLQVEGEIGYYPIVSLAQDSDTVSTYTISIGLQDKLFNPLVALIMKTDTFPVLINEHGAGEFTMTKSSSTHQHEFSGIIKYGRSEETMTFSYP